jgi:DnaJ-domain-containing protein 1
LPDKFPEAFRRFEQAVNTDRIKTFTQLTLAFANWAGSKWMDTSKQLDALAVQANKLRIPVEDYYRREEQRHQWDRAVMTGTEERMFSKKYSSFEQWQSKTVRTTAYQKRVSNYMWNHPNATLQQARGHTKRSKR